MLNPIFDFLGALNELAEDESLADLRLLQIQRLQIFKDTD